MINYARRTLKYNSPLQRHSHIRHFALLSLKIRFHATWLHARPIWTARFRVLAQFPIRQKLDQRLLTWTRSPRPGPDPLNLDFRLYAVNELQRRNGGNGSISLASTKALELNRTLLQAPKKNSCTNNPFHNSLLINRTKIYYQLQAYRNTISRSSHYFRAALTLHGLWPAIAQRQTYIS